MEVNLDIKEELQKAKDKRQEIILKINALKDEEQGLLQEALKLDGEVRALERLAKQEAPNAKLS